MSINVICSQCTIILNKENTDKTFTSVSKEVSPILVKHFQSKNVKTLPRKTSVSLLLKHRQEGGREKNITAIAKFFMLLANAKMFIHYIQLEKAQKLQNIYFYILYFKFCRIFYTAWKVSVFGVFVVRIFPHSYWIVWMRENTDQKNSEYWHFSLRVSYWKANE